MTSIDRRKTLGFVLGGASAAALVVLKSSAATAIPVVSHPATTEDLFQFARWRRRRRRRICTWRRGRRVCFWR